MDAGGADELAAEGGGLPSGAGVRWMDAGGADELAAEGGGLPSGAGVRWTDVGGGPGSDGLPAGGAELAGGSAALLAGSGAGRPGGMEIGPGASWIRVRRPVPRCGGRSAKGSTGIPIDSRFGAVSRSMVRAWRMSQADSRRRTHEPAPSSAALSGGGSGAGSGSSSGTSPVAGRSGGMLAARAVGAGSLPADPASRYVSRL